MKIREYIKSKRNEANLTQYELADLLNVKRWTVACWEQKNQYATKKMETLLKPMFPSWVSGDEWLSLFENIKERKRCSVFRCDSYAVAKNCCDKHYREVLKFGKVRKDSDKRAKKGTGHLKKRWVYRCNKP